MRVNRLENIKHYIIEKGSATYQELKENFEVSLNTIRRDVNELEKQGSVEKVYGGVRFADNYLAPFNQRNDTQLEVKKNIAKLAVGQIEEGDAIFIDSGTTTGQMASFLPEDIFYTVITNNFDIIQSCTRLNNIDLFIVGTKYNPTTRSFINFSDKSEIDLFNINKAFMASTGVSIENGVTNANYSEYKIKKYICSISNDIYLLVDSTKFGKSTLLTYSELNEINFLVTDNISNKKTEDFLRVNKVNSFITI